MNFGIQGHVPANNWAKYTYFMVDNIRPLHFKINFPVCLIFSGKRPLGRPRRRWEDLEEIGVNAGNWVDSAQDRNYWRALVNAALNLRVP